MGMTPQNSIATMVASKPHALWDVPAHWTLAQVTFFSARFYHASACVGL